MPHRRATRAAYAVMLVLVSVAWTGFAVNAADVRPSGRLALVQGSGGEVQIYVVNAAGTGLRRLTSGPGRKMGPVWSPDGRRIAFVWEGPGGTQIAVMNEDGSGMRRLTDGPGRSLFPTWSPDGRRIAFARESGTGPQVHVVNLDGSNDKRLTGPPAANDAPAWSPDGRHIAYLSTAPGGVTELFVMEPDGAGKRQIPVRATGTKPGVRGVAWSPDGRHLAVVTRVSQSQDEISVINLDGSNQRRFSTGYAPAWAPDGARIAYTVTHAGDAEIYVRGLARGPARLLTDRQWISVRPTWSPDGRYIAFLSVRTVPNAAYVIRADGSGERWVAPVYTDFSVLPLLAWRPR